MFCVVIVFYCVCTDLQSTMAPLLTFTQLFILSVPTVSTRILPNRSEMVRDVINILTSIYFMLHFCPVCLKKLN